MDDIKRLNGYWKHTYVNDSHQAFPPEDLGLNTITKFTDGKFVVTKPDGQCVLAGVYKIDSTASPSAIDWTDTTGEDAGKTFLAIYKLTPDEFMFIAADEGLARPSSFLPQSGHTLRKFIRLS
ncbi:uncharacterized domain TIGR03067 protein [Alteromonadaceae bacterium Bs31]|nr:uncharacterized domain TIGR03067 protein [Alteromonadaceae bacterium Bs31]